MSDANRTAVRVLEESSFGETPATPAFQDLRFTSSNLAYVPEMYMSEEIRADRMIPEIVRVGFETSGDIGTELSYGNLDYLLKGVMFSDWTILPFRENPTADSTIYNVLGSTGQYAFTLGSTFFPGMLCKFSGFSNPENNRVGMLIYGSNAEATLGGAAGCVTEIAPPAGARVKQVGFQADYNDLHAEASPALLRSSVLDFTTLNISKGMWIKIGGSGAENRFATLSMNSWARVTKVTAHTIELENLPAGWTDDVGLDKSIRIFYGDYIRNGVTERSYTLELEYLGLPVPEWEYYRGMEIATCKLEMPSQEIIRANLGFLGKNSTLELARLASATTVAAPSEIVLNTSLNIGSIREGGVSVAGPNYVTDIKLNIDNSLRGQNAVGSEEIIGIGVGRFKVDGSMTAYFGTSGSLQKVRSGVASSYDFCITDSVGNKAYLFDLPRIKFTSGNNEVQGADTDIMIEVGFHAIRHPEYNYTLHLQKFDYFENSSETVAGGGGSLYSGFASGFDGGFG